MPRLLAAILLTVAFALPAAAAERGSHLLLETGMGDILIELNHRRAPLTAGRIATLAAEGHYDGLIFHRVIPGFVAQGGGFSPRLKPRTVEETIFNESGNGLRNQRATVGLARGEDPHSGNAQFYINLDDNERLDPNPRRWGYTVFGRVVAGMDVVDAMAEIPTEARGGLPADVPERNIIIHKARPLDHETALDWILAWEDAQDTKGKEE